MKNPRRPYKRNITRLRHKHGCLTDCVAYVLNLHPHRIPYFVYPRDGWMDRLRAFFKKHGWEVRWHECSTPPARGTFIVCGDSLKYKTYCHVVVYRSGKLVFDPQFPSEWSDKRITHRLVMTRTER